MTPELLLNPEDLIAAFTVSRRSVALAAGVVAKLADVNPSRTSLMISIATGGASLFISPTNTVTAQGPVIQSADPTFRLSWAIDPALVVAEWFGLTSAGPMTVIVIEGLYDPERIGRL